MGEQTTTKKRNTKPKKTKPFFGPKKKLDVKINKPAKKGKAMAVPLKKVPKKEKTEAKKIQIASLKKPFKEIQGTSKNYQKHKASDQVLKEAQDSAILPSQKANETVANRSQVEVMDAQTKDTKSFDKEGFRKKLKEQINDTIKSNEDAKKIGKNGVDENVTKDISKTVGEEKTKAGGKVEASSIVPPAVPVTPADEATTQEPQKLNVVTPGVKTFTTQKADLAPVKHPDEETDFTKETKVLDDDYKQNNLSQDKLQNSNEPRFIAADNQKQDSEAKAQELTDTTRADEKKKINGTRWSNTKSINEGYNTMLQKQDGTNKGRFDQQTQKSKEENKIRSDVHKQLTAIFNGANSTVLACFTAIDFYIEKIFGLSITKNLDKFSERVAKLLDDNDGWEWVGKKLTGSHVQDETEIFDVAKKEFIEHMQTPLDDLVDYVDKMLSTANKAIQDGRKKADEFWSKQSDETKKIAGDIYDETNTKFEELESSVQNKESSVIDSVTEKFSSALDELDERFEKAKIENMSWLDRAIAAVKSVINTIIELKNAIQRLAQKAAKYAEAIIDDPITFFGNLADGIGQGFTNFKNNIDKHLIKGVLEWLTGSMAGSEIVLPKELNFEGITSLVLQILGITMKKIKDLVIGVIGKERFEFIEKGVDATMAAGNKILNIFKILNEKGLAGLWEFIMEEFDNLKEMLIENVKTFVIETITMKAMEYLLSLLIPGAGFIRAAQLLIKFVITLFQKAAQIIKILDGILDTFGDILNKNLGAVVAKVENVLSGFLSLAISFLAAVLGLDGIVGKVQKFIQQKIRPKIDQVLKNIANKIKKVVEKIGLTKLIDKSMKAVEKGKAWVDDKKKKAKETAKKYGEKFLDILGIKKKFKGSDGHDHTLFFEGSHENPTLMVASEKMTYQKFLAEVVPDSNKDKYFAIDIAKKIDEIKGSKYTSSADDKAARKAEEEKREKVIKFQLDRLSQVTASFFGAMEVGDVKHNSTTRGGATVGQSVEAKHLSKKGRADGIKGSQPKDTPNALWDILKKRKKGNGTYYIRGHLLNDNIFGPGTWDNMAPIPGSFNTGEMEPAIESQAKKAVQSGGTVDFDLTFNFGRSKSPIKTGDSAEVQQIKNAEEHVPLGLTASLSVKLNEKSKPIYGGKSLPITIDDNYEADKIEKSYILDKKTFQEHVQNGIPLKYAVRIADHFSSSTKTQLNNYKGQIGCEKDDLLAFVQAKDPSYTAVEQLYNSAGDYS
jgi:hypothetical protein